MDINDSDYDFCNDILFSHYFSYKITLVFSNGSGRTGVFIALDRLFSQVNQGHDLNVYNTVLMMREQRPKMVANLV